MRKITGTKTVDFCVKIFHMMKEVMFRCFITLKTPKKTYLNLGRVFILGGFRVLGQFVRFLVGMD